MDALHRIRCGLLEIVGQARALADRLGGAPRATAARVDVASVDAAALRALGAFAVVDAAGPVQVSIEARDGAEAWTRSFGGRRFRSWMSLDGARHMEEQFGPFSFRLLATADPVGLSMRVASWRIGPLPLPRRLAPHVIAREDVDEEGRFRFDVSVTLPGLERLVRYSGWLAPA